MSNVIKFPRHKLRRCGDGCDGCFVCRGELALCETCGGAEASMPTHCPGERMSPEQGDMVQAGAMDYKDGEWRWYGYTAREVFDA